MPDAPLWQFTDFAAAMDARVLGSAPAHVTGISIDSRTLAPGDAFFAIRGERFDGHDFVAAAFRAGASAAVVAEARLGGLDLNGALCLVRDPLDALAALARAARDRSRARVIAVTGSVGKTGTKEALRLALARQGEVHASAASHNNHWGVPLSLARLPANAPYAVFEIGMNHAGEITPLTRLVRPHVAVITTVEPVHLEFFDSVAAIAEAKAEIFLGLAEGGTAVLNRDNAHFDLLARRAREAGARIVAFGAHESADVRLLDLAREPEGSRVRARVHGRDIDYRIGAPGRHLAVNSLAVLAAAEAAGADPALAALALADLAPPKGRGARSVIEVEGGAVTLIDESYNANPASMRAALTLLGEAPIGRRGRRVAVLGDMLELGSESPQLHAALAGPVLEAGIDRVFAAGPLMRRLWEALPVETRGYRAETAAELQDPLLAALRPGDAVMVKGSLGSRMGPLVEALKSRYAARSQTQDA